MPAWVPAAASAAANLIGSIYGAERSASSAREMMRFQKHMYRHRHQYEVQDLRKAGLNPILSAGGSPGGAPGGAQVDYPNVAADAVGSAVQLRLLKAQTKLIEEQARKTEAEADIKGVYGPVLKETKSRLEQGVNSAKEVIERTKKNRREGRSRKVRTPLGVIDIYYDK